MNRANRLKRRRVLRWSIVCGIVFAALFGLIIYWLNTPRINWEW